MISGTCGFGGRFQVNQSGREISGSFSQRVANTLFTTPTFTLWSKEKIMDRSWPRRIGLLMGKSPRVAKPHPFITCRAVSSRLEARVDSAARAIPAECTWSSNAPMILSQSDIESSFILGWVNSRLIRTLIEMQSTADDYVPNSLKCLPWAEVNPKISDEISSTTTRLVTAYRQLEAWLETDPYFQTPFHSDGNLSETPGPNQTGRNDKINEILRMQSKNILVDRSRVQLRLLRYCH